MKFGVSSNSKYDSHGSTEKTDNYIKLGLRPNKNVKEEVALNAEYNSIKLFDGWFYFSEDIKQFVKHHFPRALNFKIDNLTKLQREIAQILA